MSGSGSRRIPWPDGLVAFWDFHQGTTEIPPAAGRRDVGSLRVVGGDPRRVADGPFGHAMTFDGRTDAFAVPANELGPLNVGASGDSVSVLGWIRREPSDTCHFVAGIWVEDDHAPNRQYGLFVDLPMYGGADRVCGHISRSGGPSPGLPYSRDYSASLRTVPFHEWHLVGYTYDGEYATSFLDGTSDAFPAYREPGAPLGAGLTYPKNPYRIPDGQGATGLNDAAADFTVGFVQLIHGPGNFFAGRIGGIAVFDRALTAEQMHDLASTTMS